MSTAWSGPNRGVTAHTALPVKRPVIRGSTGNVGGRPPIHLLERSEPMNYAQSKHSERVSDGAFQEGGHPRHQRRSVQPLAVKDPQPTAQGETDD